MQAKKHNTVRMIHPAELQTATSRDVAFTVIQVRKKLEIKGQGTIGFNLCAKKRFRIQFRSGCNSLLIDIGENSTSFRIISRGQPDKILCEVEKNALHTAPFIDTGHRQTYWFSLDKCNNLLRFGKGEMLAELCELEFDFSHLRSSTSVDWIDKIECFSIAGKFEKEELKQIKTIYRRLPVTTSAPPIIVDRNEIDMCLIDSNAATVVNNLSGECEQLYNNVAGRNLSLNTADFIDFSDAINWSIMTEGAICHTRLKEKSAKLANNRKKQCYLRITVGENLGDSPGAPYVLEIWPGQHFSPIHRHAECNAIIKVLHGSLSCRWFKSLHTDETRPFQQAVVSAGQVTWLAPDQFQTHQLYNHNIEGNMCATIQCYKYSKSDAQHYEFFDYIDEETDEIHQFVPLADWRYSEFKNLIREEWSAYKESIKQNGIVISAGSRQRSPVVV